MPRPARPELALLLAALLLGLWTTSAAWLQPGGVGVPQTHFSDGHVVATVLSADAVGSGEIWDLWTTRAGWPGGVMLRPLLWPVIALSLLVGPAWALTLAWTLAPVLGAVGGLVLARVLGAGVWGRVLAGALTAWPMWCRVTLANGQVEQAGLGLVALVWAAAVWAEAGGRGRVLLAPLGLAGLGLAAPNLALTAALGLGLLAGVRGLGDRRRLPRHGAILALGLGAALVANAYHGANFERTPNLFRPRLRAPAAVARMVTSQVDIDGWDAIDSAQLEDATPESLVVPLGPVAFARNVQHSPYLGTTLLLAALVGAARRGRRALPMLVVAGGLLALSVGATLWIGPQAFRMPWALVEALATSAATSGTPFRLVLGAVVALAAAAGLGLPDPPPGARGWAALAAPLLAVSLGGLAWLETGLLPGRPLPLAARPLARHPALAVLEGGVGAVVDLPLPGRAPCNIETAHYLTGAAWHDRPYLHTLDVGTGFAAHGANQRGMQALDQALSGPGCPADLVEHLGALGIGAVVAHDHGACRVGPRVRTCLEAALGAPVAEGDGVAVWTLPAAVPGGHQDPPSP